MKVTFKCIQLKQSTNSESNSDVEVIENTNKETDKNEENSDKIGLIEQRSV